MYGYFRPFKPELKIREYESYKAIYCGLCLELELKYGFLARMLVNYDAASFIAFMEDGAGEWETGLCRCPVNPLGRKSCAAHSKRTGFFAAASVILFWWKLADDINDGSLWERLRARLLRLIYRKAYKKAARDLPDFAEHTAKTLGELKIIESQGGGGDSAADCFSRIISSFSQTVSDEKKRRVFKETLYHIGRCIYYIDALDDFEKDIVSGGYNPISSFGATPEETKAAASHTIDQSIIFIQNSCELLEDAPTGQSLRRNLVCLGLPAMLKAVEDRDTDGRKTIFGSL